MSNELSASTKKEKASVRIKSMKCVSLCFVCLFPVVAIVDSLLLIDREWAPLLRLHRHWCRACMVAVELVFLVVVSSVVWLRKPVNTRISLSHIPHASFNEIASHLYGAIDYAFSWAYRSFDVTNYSLSLTQCVSRWCDETLVVSFSLKWRSNYVWVCTPQSWM